MSDLSSRVRWVGALLIAGCGGGSGPGSSLSAAESGIPIDTQTGPDTETSGTETEDEESTATPGCSGDDECGDAEICEGNECVAGCRDASTCDGGACCGNTCVDTMTDAAHCGACGEPCGDDMMCVDGQCLMGDCEDGFADCDGSAANGCETEGECACEPGAMQACYSGEADTQDVGECRSGMQVCNEFGTAWGSCDGEVLPETEVCANSLDDNCNGMADEDVDADGDGFTVCGGDCCDEAGRNCSNPELVNAGAFEVDGNDVDDDCDGTADNPLDPCDAGLATNSGNALDYTRAIDLCQFTEETPADPADAVWGVIDATITRADGAGSPNANQRSIRDDFGTAITSQFGQRLAVLSTGHAADDDDDNNPNYAAFQQGVSFLSQSAMPADWLAANGGNLPNAPDCPDPDSETAFNPVMLNVRVRVPTNANSFSVQMYFFSAEYPEWVCTPFNDFFVALVDSTDPGNPADGNIAIYDDGVDTWPVGINLVSAAAGLFTACQNGAIAQCGDGGNYAGCAGTGELLGTGFDVVVDTPPACVPNVRTGGGTGWLTMSGNVEPGEIVDIRFAIWDTSDGAWDSLVLLDNWQWNVDASEPGVKPS